MAEPAWHLSSYMDDDGLMHDAVFGTHAEAVEFARNAKAEDPVYQFRVAPLPIAGEYAVEERPGPSGCAGIRCEVHVSGCTFVGKPKPFNNGGRSLALVVHDMALEAWHLDGDGLCPWTRFEDARPMVWLHQPDGRRDRLYLRHVLAELAEELNGRTAGHRYLSLGVGGSLR